MFLSANGIKQHVIKNNLTKKAIYPIGSHDEAERSLYEAPRNGGICKFIHPKPAIYFKGTIYLTSQN